MLFLPSNRCRTFQLSSRTTENHGSKVMNKPPVVNPVKNNLFRKESAGCGALYYWPFQTKAEYYRTDSRKPSAPVDKKNPQSKNALRIAPCLLDPSVGIGPSTYRFPEQHQAGLLAHGSAYSPVLPISKRQWFHRISSPFTAAGPLPNFTGFPIKLILYLMLKSYVLLLYEAFEMVSTTKI